MMNIQKNYFVAIITACILAIIIVIILYFVFFFNKMAIPCDSMEKLSELMRKDFSSVEITDIQHKYVKDKAIGGVRTQIFVFIKEFGELELNEDYFYRNGEGISDASMEYIPPNIIANLEEIGIELPQIQKHGERYNQIKVGFSIVPYTIHWFQIDETYDHKSNFIIFASVPRKVLIERQTPTQGDGSIVLTD